jgi:site-specific recombinase XerD
MSRPPRARQLAAPDDTESFELLALRVAMPQITRNRNTADAYARDVGRWLMFCRARAVDPFRPSRHAVAAWMDEMIAAEIAPKTRQRRVSALCSVYRELRRDLVMPDGSTRAAPVAVPNPFSVDEGPKRERKAVAIEPTPVADPAIVQAMLETCEPGAGDAPGARDRPCPPIDPTNTRDRALIRVLWATGLRRSSVVDMLIDRLRPGPDGDGYETTVTAKGNKRPRVWIRGGAAEALAAYLAELAAGGVATGPLWRGRRGRLTARGVAAALRRRAKLAGAMGRISPHMMRVAFLTFNESSLDARQDAAGHADPATTRGYDRAAWRGREAFAKMPEIEQVAAPAARGSSEADD